MALGVIGHFVDTRMSDDPGLELCRVAFRAACEMVDMIMRAQNCITPLGQAAVELNVTISLSITALLAAYGVRELKPKVQWCCDVGQILERSGTSGVITL